MNPDLVQVFKFFCVFQKVKTGETKNKIKNKKGEKDGA
jgi:hypothetical protein